MDLKPGDVAVHHENTWHFSGPNQSHTRTRNVLVVHYLRGDVSFSESTRANYIYGRYKLFGSNVLREEFFPTVFPPSKFVQSYLFEMSKL
jgi:ectoine hydroxylase-related dioxygenase (phytanoyl-CoA dioxygenase family)